jgi:methionyl-tRNA formyltransferase
VPRIERWVFFGTPEFAVPALEALVAAGRRPLVVVSQPARPAGRGKRLVEPAVARRARELGLAVAQPAKVRSPEFLDRFRELAPDLAVVVAFGQIFPRALLEQPALGCLNLHASLLPRWRGAAPIAAAIEAGDVETGVSIQWMREGVDTGPVLAERRLAIGPEETAGELSGRLARAGAELLVATLAAIERGETGAREQEDGAASYAPKLAGPVELDLGRDAVALSRIVRARSPEPGATLRWRGESLRVLHAVALPAGGTPVGDPGTVLGVEGDRLRVAAGGASVLALARVQRPGRAPVSGRDFANGARLVAGRPWEG